MPAGVLIQALSWLAGHLILVTLAALLVMERVAGVTRFMK